jgi:tRNA A-37 threonylcarbamoyl transferase component Bud32
MKQISKTEYDELVRGAELTTWDRHGDKVFVRQDQKVVKLFRTKRLLSSAQFYPYALRFKHNSEALKKHGIACVSVEDIAYCSEIKRHIVVYPMLEGDTLREALHHTDDATIIDEYSRFIAKLHESGIYFRSLHMGNVLYKPGGHFALIDVADMSVSSSPLGIIKRLRNFRHLARYAVDVECICRHGIQRFMANYFAAGSLGPLSQRLLLRLLKFDCPTTDKSVA